MLRVIVCHAVQVLHDDSNSHPGSFPFPVLILHATFTQPRRTSEPRRKSTSLKSTIASGQRESFVLQESWDHRYHHKRPRACKHPLVFHPRHPQPQPTAHRTTPLHQAHSGGNGWPWSRLGCGGVVRRNRCNRRNRRNRRRYSLMRSMENVSASRVDEQKTEVAVMLISRAA